MALQKLDHGTCRVDAARLLHALDAGRGIHLHHHGAAIRPQQVDAGYVMLKGRPYIAAFMTTYLSKDSEGGDAIGEASRAVFDYFDRIGAEGSYGRRIR